MLLASCNPEKTSHTVKSLEANTGTVIDYEYMASIFILHDSNN